MIMHYSSFFAATDRNISPGRHQQQEQHQAPDNAMTLDQKRAVLSTLSTELMARFGWMGFSPPNSDGWRIPLMEVDPFDVPPQKREHWMKVWRAWKENGQVEAFPFSLVYLYGRNKLALFPTTNITPYAEAKRLGYHLPPPSIRRKIRYHEKFNSKEQKLMKGLEEFTSDLSSTLPARIAKRLGAIAAGNENMSRIASIPNSPTDEMLGRVLQTTSLNNRQISRVVSPPTDPPSNRALLAPSKSSDGGALEFLRQRNPFPLEATGKTAFSYPPGFEQRNSSRVQESFDEIDNWSDDVSSPLERSVINAAKQVWKSSQTHTLAIPITSDHVAIQCNYQPSLGVTSNTFTQLVTEWIIHKHGIEKFHNQWFKDRLLVAQSSTLNTTTSDPWASSSSSNTTLLGLSNYI